uniref:Uncharacterized protein n=1 Tax=Kalanchoe fedtschenkoi TaxID=63787 RepID=A0A7N1A0K3_KALFE
MVYVRQISNAASMLLNWGFICLLLIPFFELILTTISKAFLFCKSFMTTPSGASFFVPECILLPGLLVDWLCDGLFAYIRLSQTCHFFNHDAWLVAQSSPIHGAESIISLSLLSCVLWCWPEE